MTTITAKVCGDIWCNPDEFRQALENTRTDEPVLIDMRAEGPSLQALGILDTLIQHCRSQGKTHELIKIINAPNNQERTVFENTHTGISHFFTMSVQYWKAPMPANDLSHRFAMFVGRSTVSRCSMMYAIDQDWVKSHFLFSTMEYDSRPLWRPVQGWRVLEDFNDWLDPVELPSLKKWWSDSRPKSLDQMTVRDQYYAKDKNTNRSILNWYHEFNIEMICETYTQGETFFPTEKTVRPLMATKPFLVYGPVRFLSRLRDMGFRTYHELWDESYDLYQGVERWRRIQAVIRNICALSCDQFSDLMRHAAVIATHNRGRLADMIVTDKSEAMLEADIVCW